MAYKLPTLMLALAACGTVDNPMTSGTADDTVSDDTAGDDTPTPGNEGTAFRFFISEANGAERSGFDSVRDAYLNAAGNLNVAPGNYYFDVNYEVCPPGLPQDEYFPETGPIGCRTFGVGANGLITTRTPAELDGTSCGRIVGVDVATGGFTIGIMPFEQFNLRCGGIAVRVYEVGKFRPDHTAILFFDAPNPPPSGPVCGNGVVEDGEECDDGNEADHDGCSALCVVEPDCHPMQH